MTNIQTETYRVALTAAREAFERLTRRLSEIESESADLVDEIARLRRTITALSAMCSEAPGFDTLGITESCMKVMDSSKWQLTTSDVVEALHDMGYDLTTQKNAAASVHAVLSRLAAQKKIVKVHQEGGVVSWRGPNYDPDDIPF